MKGKTGVLLTITLTVACAFLIFPAQSSAGAKKGLGYCLDVLIPSLYPFMVLSVFVVKSGLAEKIGSFFDVLTQKVFKLPGCTAATVFMSLIGGYPAGARSIAALYAEGKISESQAGRMLCFCVNAGPSFVITAVGAGFLRNQSAGILLFVSQIIVFLLLGILSGLTAKEEKNGQKKNSTLSPNPYRAFIVSATDAAEATMNMCCFVILFAALLNLLRLFVMHSTASTLLSAILEVTGGCSDLAREHASLYAIAFAIGWGGICVHFQVLSCMTEIRFSRMRFIFFRLLQGFLTALVLRGLMLFLPESIQTFCTIKGPLHGDLSASAPAAAAVFLLCVLLLFNMPREKLANSD